MWGGILHVQNCDSMQRSHKKVIKNLFSHHFPNLNYESILKKLKILKIKDIYTYCITEFYYRIKNNNFFPEIAHEFTQHEVPYNIRSNNINEPFPRVNTIRINYNYQIPHNWNNLNQNIKSCENLGRFKSTLKEYLLNRYAEY